MVPEIMEKIGSVQERLKVNGVDPMVAFDGISKWRMNRKEQLPVEI